jgi:hypothetical protein
MYQNTYILERISPQWQQERRADAQPSRLSTWLQHLRPQRSAR